MPDPLPLGPEAIARSREQGFVAPVLDELENRPVLEDAHSWMVAGESGG